MKNDQSNLAAGEVAPEFRNILILLACPVNVDFFFKTFRWPHLVFLTFNIYLYEEAGHRSQKYQDSIDKIQIAEFAIIST